MSRIAKAIDMFVFGQEYAIERVRIIRICMAIVCGVWVVWGLSSPAYSELADVLSRPAWTLPGWGFIVKNYDAIRTLSGVLALLVAVGVRLAVTLPLLTVTFCCAQQVSASFYNWNYASAHLPFFLIVLLIAECGTRHRSHEKPNIAQEQLASFALAFMQTFVAAVYWQAGLSKLIAHGWGWFSSSTLSNIMSLDGTAIGRTVMSVPVLADGLALLVGVFELAFPFMFFFPRLRYFAVSAATLFHLCTYVLMGISFWQLWLLYPAIFLFRPRKAN